MKLPRDLSGIELVSLLRRYGYTVTRQTGSHMRLTSYLRGTEHHISIPRHDPLKIGTLNSIVTEVARYLDVDKEALATDLF